MFIITRKTELLKSIDVGSSVLAESPSMKPERGRLSLTITIKCFESEQGSEWE